eukprot:EG_transcript_20784
MRGLLLAVALCLVLGLAGVAGKKEKVVLYDEVPYIECAVCREAVQAAWAGAEKLRQEKGKAREDDLNDLTESLCDPETDHGEWLSGYDVVQKDRELQVVKRADVGHCKKECNTVAYACLKHIQEVQGDLAEALYLQKPKTAAKLASQVCQKWTKACKKDGKAPPLPEGFTRKDETFKEADAQARDAFKMMRKMKAAGMGGMSMYSRDDMDEIMQAGPEAMEEFADEF